MAEVNNSDTMHDRKERTSNDMTNRPASKSKDGIMLRKVIMVLPRA
jgi:hypothetical protein